MGDGVKSRNGRHHCMGDGVFGAMFSAIFEWLVCEELFVRYESLLVLFGCPLKDIYGPCSGLWGFAGLHSLLHGNPLFELSEIPCGPLFGYFSRR